MEKSFPIVVLISGTGSNLQAIIDQCHLAQSPVNISAVVSNQAKAQGLQRATQAGIKTQVVSASEFPDRHEYDRQLMRTIDHYQPRLVVLAGFMRILSREFVEHYQHQLINIHPSLLPDFRGLNTHQRAIDAGVKTHGATVHYVTYELDSGPVVLQAKVSVDSADTPASLAERVLEKEHIIYPMVINWIAQGKVQYRDQNIYVDGNKMAKPLQYPIEPADS